MISRFRRFLPPPVALSAREQARSILGALLGLACAGLAGMWTVDASSAWLVAPLGASALLAFALPSSPLAQPWPVFGGNVLSALIGIACGKLIGAPLAAVCVALGASICAMFLLRCLHPPGGAATVMAALGAGGPEHLGYAFVLMPVAVNSAALVCAAVAYNRLCGRRYPLAPAAPANPHRTADPLPGARAGVSEQDLDHALRQRDTLLDISREDLQELVMRSEMQAYQRHFGHTDCAEIMARDVITAEFGTSLQEAWRLLRDHRIKALPVINRFRRVIGIVTEHDFLRQADLDRLDGFSDRVRNLLRPAPGATSDKPEVVGQIMTARVRCAMADQPIASLVPLFSDSGLHHLPVVDGNQRLVGIVTQSDLVAALYRAGLEQAGAGRMADAA
ncbi:HPP family protein [Noviherbaspirillum aridicola]|uniref:Membrane protein n=1 Tax=Noviherbaspirillum aridicola TaxID=2849687 RepID=A0ABQ4PZV7_9BURK|nr:HPP family protein [Noviherbaspirillum aridicola]GIZ50438.1 membrane protein [Noviherbaspirillum aridicola]